LKRRKLRLRKRRERVRELEERISEAKKTHRIGLHRRAPYRMYDGVLVKGETSAQGRYVELRRGRLGKIYGSPVYYEVTYTRIDKGQYPYQKVVTQTPHRAAAKREFRQYLKDMVVA
jgi:hypothetical protein